MMQYLPTWPEYFQALYYVLVGMIGGVYLKDWLTK